MSEDTISKGSFTVSGYNDEPKPCPKRKCKGQVRPTFNANVGKCDKCGETFAWSRFVK